MNRQKHETGLIFDRLCYRTEHRITADQVLLAEVRAGESGRVTDVLLMDEIGWTLAHEFPGCGTMILEQE